MKKHFRFLLAVCIISPCLVFAQNKDAQSKAKEDIMAAETAFCSMAKEKGVEAAFLAYAADDAVIIRTTKTYKGKEGIKKYYDRQDKNDQLTWKPSFVSASESGDMGYTYGEYDFSGVRAGSTLTDHGIFHTVWKKQKDGSWKFVLD
jgi:ketosteroid isomerase-like protein